MRDTTDIYAIIEIIAALCILALGLKFLLWAIRAAMSLASHPTLPAKEEIELPFSPAELQQIGTEFVTNLVKKELARGAVAGARGVPRAALPPSAADD
jgi:hypothetical protein